MDAQRVSAALFDRVLGAVAASPPAGVTSTEVLALGPQIRGNVIAAWSTMLAEAMPLRARSFMSGLNDPARIAGLIEVYPDTNADIGTSLKDCSQKCLVALSRVPAPQRVFVDSGAYSEVDEKFVVVDPISDEQWRERLASALKLGEALGERAFIMAPDRVGSQAITFDRLTTYRDQVRAIAATGAQLMLALQPGDKSLTEFLDAAEAATGIEFIPAFPMRKGPVPFEVIAEFVRNNPGRPIHLLGMGRSKAPFMKRLEAMFPDLVITHDANELRAIVGNKSGMRRHTRSSHEAIEELAEFVFAPGDSRLPDFTDAISEPSGWLSKAHRKRLAQAWGLRGAERKLWIEDPDEWVESPDHPNAYEWNMLEQAWLEKWEALSRDERVRRAMIKTFRQANPSTICEGIHNGPECAATVLFDRIVGLVAANPPQGLTSSEVLAAAREIRPSVVPLWADRIEHLIPADAPVGHWSDQPDWLTPEVIEKINQEFIDEGSNAAMLPNAVAYGRVLDDPYAVLSVVAAHQRSAWGAALRRWFEAWGERTSDDAWRASLRSTVPGLEFERQRLGSVDKRKVPEPIPSQSTRVRVDPEEALVQRANDGRSRLVPWHAIYGEIWATAPGERGYRAAESKEQLIEAAAVERRRAIVLADRFVRDVLDVWRSDEGPVVVSLAQALDPNAFPWVPYSEPAGDDVDEDFLPVLLRTPDVDWTPAEVAAVLAAAFPSGSEFTDLLELPTYTRIEWLRVVERVADHIFPRADTPEAVEAVSKLRIVPITKEQAISFIREHHSKLDRFNPRGFVGAIGAARGHRLVAVATINTPTGHNDRALRALELTRIASDGTVRNASSMLASRAIDVTPLVDRGAGPANLFVTYQLLSERGSTYRALKDKGGAGSPWNMRPVALIKGKAPSGARQTDASLMSSDKIRWEAGPAAAPADWSLLDRTESTTAPSAEPTPPLTEGWLREVVEEEGVTSAERELAERREVIARKAQQGGDSEARAQLRDADKLVRRLRDWRDDCPSCESECDTPDATPARMGDVEYWRGAATTVYFPAPDGNGIGHVAAHYALVPASSVIASNDPFTFSPDKRYPAELQERDYSRDRSEQAKVKRAADNWISDFYVNSNPDAVNGPPIVDHRGFVLGGNSRAMSIARVARDAPEKYAGELAAAIREHGAVFGLDGAPVAGMILVRVLDGEFDQRSISRDLNRTFTQTLGDSARHVSLGRLLPAELYALLGDLLAEPDMTLSKAIQRRSAEVIQLLRAANLITPQNETQWIKQRSGRLTDKLSADGRNRLVGAIMGAFVNDKDVLSRTPPSLEGLYQRLAPVAMSLDAWDPANETGYNWVPALRIAMSEAAELATMADWRAAFQTVDMLEQSGERAEIYNSPWAASALEWLLDIARKKPAVATRALQTYWRSIPPEAKGEAALFARTDEQLKEAGVTPEAIYATATGATPPAEVQRIGPARYLAGHAQEATGALF